MTYTAGLHILPIMHTYRFQRTCTYLITVTADPHEKVVWFDISVDEVLCVYIFNPADHLKMKKTVVKYFTNVFTLFQIHYMMLLLCLHVNPNGSINSS